MTSSRAWRRLDALVAIAMLGLPINVARGLIETLTGFKPFLPLVHTGLALPLSILNTGDVIKRPMQTAHQAQQAGS
jgi:hypothetical protein